MAFNKIRLYNFRNLKNAEINLNAKEIFLIGDNGQGKSNFIEAVYLSCYGSSFRTHLNNRLIRNNEESALIKTSFKYLDEIDREITVKLTRNRKKEIFIDLKKLKDRKELILNIPCIIFSHDDMEYISGSPKKRRLFFNQTMSLTDLLFLNTYRQYNKILKNRNILLKEGKYSLIDLYNKKIAELGFEIYEKRRKTVMEFNKTFSPVFSEIYGTENSFNIVYKPKWGNISSSNEALKKIEASVQKDKILGISTSGPHRDDFIFNIDDNNFSIYASTGQIRLVALILKLSQAIYFTGLTGQKPVLLLDDVLLELDPKKKLLFIDNLPEYKQAFYTFLSDENYLKYKKNTTILFKLVNGRIEQ